MNTGDYLKQTTSLLESSGVTTARLDCLIIMEFILSIDRSKILAEPKAPINQKHIKLLNEAVAKRAKHVPIAYIINKTEFYGRSFYINEAVLEPRPESETMIDMFKVVSQQPIFSEKIRVCDVGTGCGALGITAALEVPKVAVDLIDIDQEALKVAKINVVANSTKAGIIFSDLIRDVDKTYDILLCNLPYVPDDFSINLAASHEPKIAIFGGRDGLDVYRRLFKSMRTTQQPPLYILTEALPFCHRKLSDIALASGYKCLDIIDFVQLFKRTN